MTESELKTGKGINEKLKSMGKDLFMSFGWEHGSSLHILKRLNRRDIECSFWPSKWVSDDRLEIVGKPIWLQYKELFSKNPIYPQKKSVSSHGCESLKAHVEWSALWDAGVILPETNPSWWNKL